MMSMVQLRRSATSVPWGFRMNGGLEYKQPLYVQKVTPDGVAFKAGLRPGDVLRQICSVPTNGMTHEQAKMEIIRAGNEVDFFVERGGMPVAPEDELQYGAPVNGRPLPVHNPAVQSRSMKVIQRSLRME